MLSVNSSWQHNQVTEEQSTGITVAPHSPTRPNSTMSPNRPGPPFAFDSWAIRRSRRRRTTNNSHEDETAQSRSDVQENILDCTDGLVPITAGGIGETVDHTQAVHEEGELGMCLSRPILARDLRRNVEPLTIGTPRTRRLGHC